MTNKSTLAQRLSHAWPWTKPIGSSPTTSRLLRYSLLCMLVLLCGGSAWAGSVTTWVKTDPTALTTNDVVVIVDQTSGKAMEANGTSAPKATEVTLKSDKSEISSGVIAAMQFKVTIGTTKVNNVDTRSYQFAYGTDYLYCTASNNGVRVGTNDDNVFIIKKADANSEKDFIFNTTQSRYLGVFNNQDWRCYTTVNNNIKGTVTAFYKKVVVESADAPDAPTFSPAAGTYYTGQYVEISCTTEGATIKKSIDGENFETYSEALPVTSTTTVYAYAELNGEKSETVSAKYVIGSTYDSFAPMHEAAAAEGFSNKAIQYRATGGMVVAYVNGNNAYLIDGSGNGILAYNKDGLGDLAAGQKMNYDDGYLTATLENFQGNAELTGIVFPEMTGGTVTVTPVEKTLPLTSANQSTLVTLKGLTYNADAKTLSDGTNTITFYDKFKTNVTLEDGKTYDVTGIIVLYNDVIEICPRTAEDITEVIEEPAEFQDFEAIVNNQTGTLLTTDEQVQGTAVSFGIAVDTEGKTTRVAADDASAIATISGTYHSDHGLTNMKVVTAVPGAVKILVGKCTYATTKITVTNSDGQTVAEYTPQGEQGSGDLVCWKNDHSNVMELIYTGEATTLTITGMKYCPFIAVKKYVAPAEFQDFEAIVNNQTGTLLTTDEQVQGTAVSFGIAVDAEGKTTRVETDDASAIATISGTYHSEHGLTGMKLVTAVPGAVKILVGKCTYAGSKITVTNSDGQTVAEYTPQGEQGSGDRVCWKNDHSNLMELIYTGEATTLTITGMQYCPYIAVKKITETEPITLDNEPATVTFPFDLGTEGQKATFSEGDANYFLNSKVAWGSNFTVNGTRTVSGITETQLKATAKETAAAESNLIKFTFTPKPGFTFTPTKVTFTATRVGTNGGKLDVAWYNSNKTNASLETAFTPNRENDTTQPYSTKIYDLTTATGIVAGEGECGLQFNLYNLDASKNYGFANIIIEGTLSGTEQDLPILASFKVNDTEYAVEDVFGDGYEATLELSKTETIVSESNPLTEITATSGEVGNVVYADATESSCKVTIPVTAGSTTLEYVLNVVHKPDFTLQYISVDGTTVLEEQTVEKDAKIGEFAYDIANVEASKEGYKARGWFKNNYVGEKWTTESVITADAKLYAVETEIEVSSDSKKYVFDLTDKNFDANDHEAFNPTGGAWHDNQHGWAFANGYKIDLLVGGKASIILGLCQYSADVEISASNDESVNAKVETDGATATIEYEGKPGTLTLSFNGTTYLHKLTIFNTTTTNYEVNGDWIIVKEGDASSLADAIEAAKEGARIFLPNGTYDLGQKTLTTIGSNNVSIIGESMDGVIIKNRPTVEGIAVTATLLNTSTGLYMQDLTLDCVAPWSGSAERGITLQDKGNQTILKNVYLKGLQDTYYSNNNNGTYYFEDGKVEGSVDYVCGNGDVYFNKTTFYTVNKSTGGKGGCIAAPNTLKSFGYIFNECTLDGVANEDGLYRLARPWAANTKCFFVNTTMIIQPNAAGWGEWSTPNAVSRFAEYNSVDANGDVIDLTGRATTIGGQPNSPILTEAEAAALAPNAIFNGDWRPQVIATQVTAPKAQLSKDGKKIEWTPANDGATAYAIFKDRKFLGITTGSEWTIEEVAGAPALRRAEEPEKTGYTIRAANSRGGFGPAAEVSPATGIAAIEAELGGDVKIYDLNGRRVMTPTTGVYIINGKKVVIK